MARNHVVVWLIAVETLKTLWKNIWREYTPTPPITKHLSQDVVSWLLWKVDRQTLSLIRILICTYLVFLVCIVSYSSSFSACAKATNKRETFFFFLINFRGKKKNGSENDQHMNNSNDMMFSIIDICIFTFMSSFCRCKVFGSFPMGSIVSISLSRSPIQSFTACKLTLHPVSSPAFCCSLSQSFLFILASDNS